MKWLRCNCHLHKIIVIIIKALSLGGLLSCAKVSMYNVLCNSLGSATMEIIPVFRTFPIDLLWRLLQATNLSGDAMAMVFFSKRFIWAHVTIATDAFIWI